MRKYWNWTLFRVFVLAYLAISQIFFFTTTAGKITAWILWGALFAVYVLTELVERRERSKETEDLTVQ